jgi:hypothetical protein
MKRTLVCLLLTAFATSASAAVLTTVPMQGSMLMPEVYYHADTDTVTVDLSAIHVTAQLTPLLISNPSDSFSPTDPWFDSLDPSRQGLAFSRRYGFDMDAMSDIPPDNRQLWIRKLSGSPDLAIYDYNASSTPKKWTPIFGTAGTSNATYWSGLMWHVGVTAPPGTNTYTATFEVYVVNTDTGLEVPGSSSGPFVLDWTDVPDGRPLLNMTAQDSGQIQLTWPASATNWTLVSASALNAPSWPAVTNEPVVFDGQRAVVLEPSESHKFFRMLLAP